MTSLKHAFAATLVSIGTMAQETDAMAERSVTRIARDIQRRILSLPEYGVFDSLNFGIKGSVVTLTGYASRPILKDSAERVVKGIEGVTSVDNKIQVLPLSPMDDGIRVEAYARIYRHPALARYGQARGGANRFFSLSRAAGGITNDPPIGFHAIHIVVDKGNIMLTGVVSNPGDKAIAGIQANQVSGAFSVDNNLLVENKDSMRSSRP
jgi:osmotically-inducible protein OsmY